MSHWNAIGPSDNGERPFVKRQVAGDQRGTPFVALRDQLEQQLGAGLAQGHEAQLVDDQELVTHNLFLQTQQPTFIAGLHQFVDQRGGGGEADRQALLAGGQPETQGDVGLAGGEPIRAIGPSDNGERGRAR